MKGKPSDKQIQLLCELLLFAFLELRKLGWQGKAEQAADLADAFHNLPVEMFSDNFDWDLFRNAYLAPYQEKYPRSANSFYDYISRFDEIKNTTS